MGLRINQNIMAFSAYRNLTVTDSQLAKSLEKLSSGFRINRAADDAAGLVISEGLRAQVNGLKVATRNAQDGISVVQTAEGALNEVHSILQRMRDLAVQAANTGSADTNALNAAQSEVDALALELDRIASATKFGTKNLLDGTFGGVGTPATLTGDAVANAAIRADNQLTPLSFLLAADGGSYVTVDWAADGTAWADSQVGADSAETSLQSAIDTALGGGVVNVEITHVSAGNWRVDLNRVGTLTGTSVAVAAAPGAGTDYTTLGLDGSTGTTGRSATVQLGGGTFQVGANAGETISVSIAGVNATTLAVNSLDVVSDASTAITAVDAAISSVSTQRAELGALQNRFEHTIANLNVATENLAASESRIRDTDMALEMVQFTRHQILLQAGTAMLAQANVAPQSVLQLLQ
jgi:flagellin